MLCSCTCNGESMLDGALFHARAVFFFNIKLNIVLSVHFLVYTINIVLYLQIALEGHPGQNYVVTESLWAAHEAEDRLTMLRLITTPYVINYVVRLVIFTLFCFVFALKVLVCTV